MLMGNAKFKEQGFLGDEVFQTREKEITHLCRIIQSTVERKVFTLEEALEAYEISLKDYELFLAKSFYNEIQDTSTGLSASDNALTYIHITMNFLNLRFENEYAGDIEKVYLELGRLSKKIKKGKPSLHDAD
jgi:hypothetical protein